MPITKVPSFRLASRVAFPLLALLAGCAAADAQTQTWTPTTVPATFNWNDNANWSPGPFPNGIGAIAILSSDLAPSGTQTVNLNQAITIGGLTIGDLNSATNGFYNIFNGTGTGSGLIFDTASGNATLVKTTGSASTDSISATVTLNKSLAADLRTGSIGISGVIGGVGGIIRSGSVITPAAASSGVLSLSNNASTYAGTTSVEQSFLEGKLTTDILSGANSVFGNSTSAIVVGVSTFLPATAGQNSQTLRLVAGSDAANYTMSRGLDFSQVTQASAGTGALLFNSDGAGGVNTNTLTVSGPVTLGARTAATVFNPQRSGMTINLTGDISGTSTFNLIIGGTATIPGVDGRGVGLVRFSNLNRSFTSPLTFGSGGILIDGVVGALNSASPIGLSGLNLANGGSTGNIVGNSNFNGNAGLNDTSPDTIRSVFLDTAGSSFARTLNLGGGNSSIPAAGGYTTAVNVINGYQFGGRNTSGVTTFSNPITASDVSVGASTTNPITVGINESLQSAAGGTVVFSGVLSDTPSAATVARVTINQLRNNPSIDGINNTTLANGSDGIPDSTANQLVGTATTGTVVLSGANTFEGGAEVLGGKLLVNNTTGSGTGSGVVTIASGATLGGTGTVGGIVGAGTGSTGTGAVTVNGILTPGDPSVANGIGTLTIGSSTVPRPLAFGAGSTFNIQVGVGASSKVALFGNLDLSTTTDTLAITGVLDGTTNYVIATFSGTRTGVFDTVTGLTGNYSVVYGANSITLAVPEPSTWAMLAAGAGLLGVTLRRRRAA